MGWAVKDLQGTFRSLMVRGVTFERFEGQDQDGARRPVAGDLLSVSD